MRKFLPWIIVVLILIVSFGTIYAVTQQSQRSEANYPQIQLAEDAAHALNTGSSDPQSVVYGHVDISESLAPFTIVYDKNGNVVSGSGYINGKIPKAPKGILTAAQGKDYNAVTWEPKTGVRIAAVSVAADKYYVLSGRSLKEVEKNEDHTLLLSAVGFVIVMALLGLLIILSLTATANEI